MQEEGAATSPASSGSVVERELSVMFTPSGSKVTETERECLKLPNLREVIRDPFRGNLLCRERRREGGGDGNTLLPTKRVRRRKGEKDLTKLNSCKLIYITAVTAALCQQLAEGMAYVALIQEPYIYRGQIRGLTSSGGTICSVAPHGNARSCMYARNDINVLLMLKLCSKDATTATAARMSYTYGGSCKELISTSAYFPYSSDEPPSTRELRGVIDYYSIRARFQCIPYITGEH
jgi:hypothetical protein